MRGNAVLCWDLGRYVNHSCSPACLGLGDTMEIAVRDILPGEQLTDDYGMLNLPRPLECRCGAPNCRGTVRGDDVLRYAREWDRQVRSAFARLVEVPQALRPFMKDTALDDMLAGRVEVPSPLRYYYDANGAPASAGREDGVPGSGLRPQSAGGPPAGGRAR